MVNYGCHINLFCIAPLCFDEVIDGDAVAKYILVASTFPEIGLHRRANRGGGGRPPLPFFENQKKVP